MGRRVISICLLCSLFLISVTALANPEGIIPEYQIENLIGFFYYEEGEYREAIKYFLCALEYNPEYVTALNNLGSSYYQLKDYDKAIYYFEKVLDLDQNYVKAYLNLGACYFWKGRYIKAYKIYLKSKKADPQYTELRIDFRKYTLLIENRLEENPEDEELKQIYNKLLEYAQEG